MSLAEQKRHAEQFRELHYGADPLLLVNVWDVASARIIEAAGFPAIATSSAGIALSLGYPDGQVIPQQTMISAIARIIAAVRVPVSADIEAGYGSSPENAARITEDVIAAGAIGMNFEDLTGEVDRPLMDVLHQVERIQAIREVSRNRDVPIVVNARTDVYLLDVGSESSRYEEALKRLRAYRDAGADCLFAPGLRDGLTIGRLVADLQFPVNVLAGPGIPPVAELRKLGVRRISLGSAPMRAALGILRQVGKELKNNGTYTALEEAPTLSDMNASMKYPR
jgi:2-methylisocitrate lyase-like PEP mutase family enzyme